MPELDDFLGGEPEEEKPVVAEAVEPEVAPEIEEPEAEAEPEPEAKPEPTETPEPADVTGLKSALQAERAQKKDHKGRADRLEGEMAAIKAQLEAIQKAPPAAPAVPAVAPTPAVIPNPIEDPQGYHAHIQQTMQQSLFNDRLNMSEAMLRQAVGNDADVDAKRERFRQMAEANPGLRAELQKAAHPYKFVYDTAAKAMAMDEIGDPTSYRAKLEAEIREKVMAEMAGTAPAPAQRVVLPQSLGTARSAGSRNTPVINAPEAFDDILAVARK